MTKHVFFLPVLRLASPPCDLLGSHSDAVLAFNITCSLDLFRRERSVPVGLVVLVVFRNRIRGIGPETAEYKTHVTIFFRPHAMVVPPVESVCDRLPDIQTMRIDLRERSFQTFHTGERFPRSAFGGVQAVDCSRSTEVRVSASSQKVNRRAIRKYEPVTIVGNDPVLWPPPLVRQCFQ